MTQEEFSTRIDVSTNFLGDVERNIKNMSFKTMQRTIDVFSMPVEWRNYLLFGIDGKNKIDLNHPIYNLIDSFDFETKNLMYQLFFNLLEKK